MPIRIYALAKELRIDSKALVDVCTKAGVTGKGSALASLTDDEAAKVKSYLTGGDKKVPSAKGPSAKGPGAKVLSAKVLSAKVLSAKVPSSGGVSKISPKSSVATDDRAITRDDYIGPGGSAGTPPNLDAKPEAKPANDANVDDKPKAPVKREPVIKLAAIPKTPQVKSSEVSPDEPAPQKPIMTLPKDAIRGAREGSSAPLEQFTRQQDKKGEAVKSGRPKTATATEPLRGRAGRDRRKSKDELVEAKEKGKEKSGSLAGMASARQARQQTRKRRPGGRQDDYSGRRRNRLVRKGTNTAAPRKGKITIELPCTIRSFSEATGIPATNILRALMSMGTMTANINGALDEEVAEMLAEEAGVDIELKAAATLEDTLLQAMEERVDDPDSLEPRPPIVTFLGHVDHGKTSLLDKVLGLDVVSGEAGGITQHIRAYTVEKDGRTVSFVDTPGHEAFTEMRARGANVTDIAVLVVAADDGVMPQTEEAISHARAADVPIVVALNKMDLPGADENRALQDLASRELLPTQWGGDIEVVKTSAMTGDGIDDLLETLLLTADINEYKANPHRPALGTCLESQQEGGRGVIAKVIVVNGTLKVGDIVVCGAAHGRIKAMHDTLTNKKVLTAGPSTPVNVLGLDVAPEAGERFYVLDDISQAREIAQQREHRSRTQALSGFTTRISFEEFQRRLEDGVLGDHDEVSVLNLIIRADVRGSIEAIQKELSKLDHPEVQVKLLQATVGGITVADVTLADASDAVIVGFNVIPDEHARSLADERGVEIRRYDIIYKLTEDIKLLLEGKLKPEEHVAELGRALVQRVFTISRVGAVAGCRVLAGTIERGCRVRVNRDGRGVGDYPLDTLRREKDDTKEVREGFECGIKLAGFNDIKEGDILEAYKIEEVARTL